MGSISVVRRECFDTVGYFDENSTYAAGEDYHLWLRIASYYEVVCLQQALIYYRFHQGSLSDERKEHVNSLLVTILLDIRNRYTGLFKQIGKEAGRRIGDVYDNMACSALQRGRMIDAWRAFEQAAMWKQYMVQVPLLRGLIAFSRMAARTLAAKMLE